MVMIHLSRSLLKALKELATFNHPNEVVVLLRGERKGDDIHINEYLVPPFGVGSPKFASFPAHMLPIDFSIMGTAHSHPSGNITPSTKDLHSFYGRILMIIGPPYDSQNLAVYKKNGESLPVNIIQKE